MPPSPLLVFALILFAFVWWIVKGLPEIDDE